METTEKFFDVIKRLGINTDELCVNPFDWYIVNRKNLLRSEIELEGEAAGVVAHLSNLVVTPRVSCSNRSQRINIQAAYVALSSFGFEFNDTKLLSIHARFCPPIDCRITVYPNRIDCKGANNLLAAYIAIEYTCSLLRRYLYNNFSTTPTRLIRCEACNLVVTCQIGFKIPVEAMVEKYKQRCVYKTPEDRNVHRKSKALFQGAIYTCYLPNGSTPRILFQDRAWVTCVACRTIEDAKLGLEEFYKVALGMFPAEVRETLRQTTTKKASNAAFYSTGV